MVSDETDDDDDIVSDQKLSMKTNGNGDEIDGDAMQWMYVTEGEDCPSSSSSSSKQQ